ncbi:MAG: hypothetical protein JWQ71_2848 [Pedosphaera sp.]|nr:hypothetical protein [Pedosphaera sp.]
MGISVAINYVARNQPAKRGAVFSIADIVSLVTQIAAARANLPMGCAAGARGSCTATTDITSGAMSKTTQAFPPGIIIVWTWAGKTTIKIIVSWPTQLARPTRIGGGIPGAVRNPSLARRARIPIAPEETIIARTRAGVRTACTAASIAAPPEMLAIGYGNRNTACIRHPCSAKRRSFVNPYSPRCSHHPWRIADRDFVGAATFRNAAKAGLGITWLENQAGAPNRNDSRGYTPNESAAWCFAGNMNAGTLDPLIHAVG